MSVCRGFWLRFVHARGTFAVVRRHVRLQVLHNLGWPCCSALCSAAVTFIMTMGTRRLWKVGKKREGTNPPVSAAERYHATICCAANAHINKTIRGWRAQTAPKNPACAASQCVNEKVFPFTLEAFARRIFQVHLTSDIGGCLSAWHVLLSVGERNPLNMHLWFANKFWFCMLIHFMQKLIMCGCHFYCVCWVRESVKM